MKAKILTEQDIEYINKNSNLTASELARRLDKPRPKIAKVLCSIHGKSKLSTKESLYKNEKDIQYIIDNCRTTTYNQIAINLGYGSRSAVARIVKQFVPDLKKLTGPAYGKMYRSQEFYDYIIDNYETLAIKEIADHLEVTEKIISHNKVKLKLEPYVSSRTSIEFYTKEYLEKNNIEYFEQYNFDKFRYDFYLPDYNYMIECNGDYWHSNPLIYPDGPKTDAQIYNHNRDKIKQSLLQTYQIQLIILWEKDIKDNLLNLEPYFKQEINNAISASNSCEAI